MGDGLKEINSRRIVREQIEEIVFKHSLPSDFLTALLDFWEEVSGRLSRTSDISSVNAPTDILVSLQEQFYAFSYHHRLTSEASESIWCVLREAALSLLGINESGLPTEHDESTVVKGSGNLVNTAEKIIQMPGEVPRMLGRYEERGLLGLGGMGEVRRVKDLGLNCNLAIKIIHRRLLGNERFEERFRQEAQIVAQLQHPNIPPVHEIGVLPDGRLFFTMQEIQGRSFSKVIRELHDASGPEDWGTTAQGWGFRRVMDAFRQVCEAVSYAHSKGVIHRDLKPSKNSM